MPSPFDVIDSKPLPQINRSMPSPLDIVDSKPLPPLSVVESKPLPPDAGLSVVESKPLPDHPIATFLNGVENFGKGFYNTTLKGAVDAVGSVGHAVINPVDTAHAIADSPAVQHPIDTAASALKNSYDTHVAMLQKAKDALDKGDYTGAIQHGTNALIPVLGPAIQAATDKYNTEGTRAEGLGELTGLGASTALAAPGAAKAVAGKAADMLQPDLGALKGSAENTYSQVLNAATRGNKARSARIVPQLLQRGETTTSLKALQARAGSMMEAAGDNLEQAYQGLPPGSSIPTKSVTDAIQQAAQDQFTVPAHNTLKGAVSPSPIADAGMNHAMELTTRIQDASTLDPATGEMVLPVDTARRLRQYYDSVAAQAGKYDAKQLAEHSAAAAHGMAADAIRSELAKDFPSVAALNKEYSFWSDVNRVTSDTLLRREGQASPLGRRIAAATGSVIGAGVGHAVGGPFGSIIGAGVGQQAASRLTQLFSSPAWRTVDAVHKYKLADAIASGSQGKIALYTARALQATAATGVASKAGAAELPAAAQAQPQQYFKDAMTIGGE